MPFPEQIDPPVDPEFNKYNDFQIARGFVHRVTRIGEDIYDLMDSEEEPQGYRLGSWVDDPDNRFGHAFGLSRTELLADTIADFKIISHYFYVDRGAERKILEGPKEMEIDTTLDFAIQADTALQIYNRDEMVHSICIMRKIKDAIDAKDDRSLLDGDVNHALSIGYLDVLRDKFGDKKSPQTTS